MSAARSELAKRDAIIREQRDEIARLRAQLDQRRRPQRAGLFGDESEFRIAFPFVWPSLKNDKGLGVSKRGKAFAYTPNDVRVAQRRIRESLQLELGGKELPLFGGDDVERELVWFVDRKEIEVTWRRIGPCDSVPARERDLVNLAALLDDVVQRKTATARQLPGVRMESCPGLIYRDDSQIASSIERRVCGR